MKSLSSQTSQTSCHLRPLTTTEPHRVAEVVAHPGLQHAVVTSVNRDDREDGGAELVAVVISASRDLLPSCTVEVLVPESQGSRAAMDIALDFGADARRRCRAVRVVPCGRRGVAGRNGVGRRNRRWAGVPRGGGSDPPAGEFDLPFRGERQGWESRPGCDRLDADRVHRDGRTADRRFAESGAVARPGAVQRRPDGPLVAEDLLHRVPGWRGLGGASARVPLQRGRIEQSLSAEQIARRGWMSSSCRAESLAGSGCPFDSLARGELPEGGAEHVAR